ncbi:hypothetical protein HXX76_014696 [Chlamydomonas incerta]|uniref:Protein kinase domain-containing protein n=1 Tax=Chlamydomonas incerta TaxID=51695 RepID=A0A835SBC7_CHLIN|nr:hypothetical protein HXX76_014696 [Chlamydomonas incerta]|eukprot:KAG2424163.1 hypothetical protein HXX76_014696 [Chlamydomonas incerta]
MQGGLLVIETTVGLGPVGLALFDNREPDASSLFGASYTTGWLCQGSSRGAGAGSAAAAAAGSCGPSASCWLPLLHEELCALMTAVELAQQAPESHVVVVSPAACEEALAGLLGAGTCGVVVSASTVPCVLAPGEQLALPVLDRTGRLAAALLLGLGDFRPVAAGADAAAAARAGAAAGGLQLTSTDVAELQRLAQFLGYGMFADPDHTAFLAKVASHLSSASVSLSLHDLVCAVLDAVPDLLAAKTGLTRPHALLAATTAPPEPATTAAGGGGSCSADSPLPLHPGATSGSPTPQLLPAALCLPSPPTTAAAQTTAAVVFVPKPGACLQLPSPASRQHGQGVDSAAGVPPNGGGGGGEGCDPLLRLMDTLTSPRLGAAAAAAAAAAGSGQESFLASPFFVTQPPHPQAGLHTAAAASTAGGGGSSSSPHPAAAAAAAAACLNSRGDGGLVEGLGGGAAHSSSDLHLLMLGSAAGGGGGGAYGGGAEAGGAWCERPQPPPRPARVKAVRLPLDRTLLQDTLRFASSSSSCKPAAASDDAGHAASPSPSAPLPPHPSRTRLHMAAAAMGGPSRGPNSAGGPASAASAPRLGTAGNTSTPAAAPPRPSLPAVVVKVVSDASSHVLCESQPPRDVRMCGNALAAALLATSGGPSATTAAAAAAAAAHMNAPGARPTASGGQQQLCLSPGTLLLCIEAAPTLAAAVPVEAGGAWAGGGGPHHCPPLSTGSTADASALPPSTALLSSAASGLGGAGGGSSLLPGGASSAASTWGPGFGYSCSGLSGCLRPGAPAPAGGGCTLLQPWQTQHHHHQHHHQAAVAPSAAARALTAAPLCPGPGQLGVYLVFEEVLPRGLLELAARELAAVMPIIFSTFRETLAASSATAAVAVAAAAATATSGFTGGATSPLLQPLQDINTAAARCYAAGAPAAAQLAADWQALHCQLTGQPPPPPFPLGLPLLLPSAILTGGSCGLPRAATATSTGMAGAPPPPPLPLLLPPANGSVLSTVSEDDLAAPAAAAARAAAAAADSDVDTAELLDAVQSAAAPSLRLASVASPQGPDASRSSDPLSHRLSLSRAILGSGGGGAGGAGPNSATQGLHPASPGSRSASGTPAGAADGRAASAGGVVRRGSSWWAAPPPPPQPLPQRHRASDMNSAQPVAAASSVFPGDAGGEDLAIPPVAREGPPGGAWGLAGGSGAAAAAARAGSSRLPAASSPGGAAGAASSPGLARRGSGLMEALQRRLRGGSGASSSGGQQQRVVPTSPGAPPAAGPHSQAHSHHSQAQLLVSRTSLAPDTSVRSQQSEAQGSSRNLQPNGRMAVAVAAAGSGGGSPIAHPGTGAGAGGSGAPRRSKTSQGLNSGGRGTAAPQSPLILASPGSAAAAFGRSSHGTALRRRATLSAMLPSLQHTHLAAAAAAAQHQHQHQQRALLASSPALFLEQPAEVEAAVAPPPTEALVAAMRRRLSVALTSHEEGQHAKAAVSQDIAAVELLEMLGHGGQGVVFRGTLHGLEVAVKVLEQKAPQGAKVPPGNKDNQQAGAEGAAKRQAGKEEGSELEEGAASKEEEELARTAKRSAMELAVSSVVAHPNIVQVYATFADVAVVRHRDAASEAVLRLCAADDLRAVGIAPDPINQVLCLEYCDAGSLASKVRGGAFRQPCASSAEQGAMWPALVPLYTSLLEVALALRHMHSKRLVHCDVKAANVLLKSSGRDPRGWSCKLSDFGCVRMLNEHGPDGQMGFRSAHPHGTVPYMPPECFLGARMLLGTSVDVYAFGVLMWELLHGRTPFKGMEKKATWDGIHNPPQDIAFQVVHAGLRPAFQPLAPAPYRHLAERCMAAHPRARPTALALVAELQQLLAEAVEAEGGGGRGASSALAMLSGV